MTNGRETPCSRGLNSLCFRTHPQWAKQALAVRLIHAIAPPSITRRLPKDINRALVVPGTTLPAGINAQDLPPGSIVNQDTTFPPGWTPGDDPPETLITPPTTAPDEPGQGVAAPSNLAPGSPLPLKLIPGGGAITYFFNEPFNDLTTNSWVENHFFGGTATITDGILTLTGPFPGSMAEIDRTHPVSIPSNFTVELSVNVQSGTGTVNFQVYTGSYRFWLYLTPPTTVSIFPTIGSCDATVANYMGTTNLFSVEVVGSLATVSMNGTPIITTCGMFADSATPKQMIFYCQNQVSADIDYFRII